MASEPSPGTIKNESLSAIKRTAIDTSGSLGALYDAYRDRVLEKLDVIDTESCTLLDEIPQCTIKNVDMNQSHNLLELIDFEEDVRLSILLKLTQTNGLASLIDHSAPINEHIRLLYYTYLDREEKVSNNAKQAERWIKSLMSPTNATHIITSVRWGISFVSVLQLPSDAETIIAIDGVLKKIQAFLNGDYDGGELDSDDLDQLKKITATKVYSNIPALAKITSINDIYNNIQLLKNNGTEHCQISYTLQPIQSIYTNNNGPEKPFICMSSLTNQSIEKYYLDVWSKMKYVTALLKNDLPKLLNEHLKLQVNHESRQWVDLKKKYIVEIERGSKLVIDVRCGRGQISQIDENLQGLEAKGHFINDLQQDTFQYWDVAELNLDNLDNEQAIEVALLKDHQHERILCSTDILKKAHSSEWDKLHRQLVKEHRDNFDLRIIYADFTYCSVHPSNIIILPLCKVPKTEETDKQSAFPQSVESKPSTTPLLPSSTEETINILLLGESGVGKSTFINAFANYLTFDTLEDAESKKPTVLIPVSFLMTFGDNFTEHNIELSVPSRSDNEDFNHPGQSVTQHCRSYVFNHTDGKKLRIIDTPGFGDTRGLDQDDVNMQHILEYISNLTHLNAVCFLLKPNTSQINTFFQTCLTQLLDFLGHNAKKNIIFCFTNARLTFYTPGDTAPLLKGILKSLPTGDIPFKKRNTFCFDSQPFRYLAALENSIKFDHKCKQEYKMSWSKSVYESNRLIDFILRDVPLCRLQGDRQSIKHAQFEIVLMIRPVLETMRNIVRNNILYEMKTSTKMIKLRSEVIHRPAYICRSCPGQFVHVDSFWILSDYPHEIQDTCHVCDCAPSQHVRINYILRYKSSNSSSNYDLEKMNTKLRNLCLGSSEPAHFLIYVACYTKEDPFLTGITRMIREEERICEEKQSNDQNLQLVKGLRATQLHYTQIIKKMGLNQQHSRLEDIYEWIQIIREYSMVHKQMKAIKEGQKKIMEQYEYDISEDLRNTYVNSDKNH